MNNLNCQKLSDNISKALSPAINSYVKSLYIWNWNTKNELSIFIKNHLTVELAKVYDNILKSFISWKIKKEDILNFVDIVCELISNWVIKAKSDIFDKLLDSNKNKVQDETQLEKLKELILIEIEKRLSQIENEIKDIINLFKQRCFELLLEKTTEVTVKNVDLTKQVSSKARMLELSHTRDKGKIWQLSEEKVALLSTVWELEDFNSTLKQDNLALREENFSFSASNTELSRQVWELSTQIETLNTEVIRLNWRIEFYTQNEQEHADSMKEKDKLMKWMYESHSKIYEEKADLLEKMNQLIITVKKIETELAKKKRKIKWTNLEEKVNWLLNFVVEIQSQETSWQQSYTKSQASILELESLQTSNAVLEWKLEQAWKYALDLLDEIATLKTENETLKSEDINVIKTNLCWYFRDYFYFLIQNPEFINISKSEEFELRVKMAYYRARSLNFNLDDDVIEYLNSLKKNYSTNENVEKIYSECMNFFNLLRFWKWYLEKARSVYETINWLWK